jgi:methyl-accepting chemotaxis protein
MDQESTIADVVEAIDNLDGRVSDMSVDVAWIKKSLENIEKLLETIKDRME